MSGLADSFREMWKTALTALGQLNTLVPDYWDGALDTALRVVRTALPLFAAVLLVLTNWVKFTKKWHPIVFIGLSAAAKAPAAHPRFRRDAGRGAGTVRLGLFSRMDGGGINGTPRGGGPVKGSMRGLLPEAIHRY